MLHAFHKLLNDDMIAKKVLLKSVKILIGCRVFCRTRGWATGIINNDINLLVDGSCFNLAPFARAVL